MIIFGLCVVLVLVLFYKRYVPVRGVRCNDWQDLDLEKIFVIDVRDYNESYTKQIDAAVNIPIAYLNRHYKEIPKRDIHIIGSNRLEKNVGIRFLRQKGFQVTSCTIINSNNQCFKENLCV